MTDANANTNANTDADTDADADKDTHGDDDTYQSGEKMQIRMMIRIKL